jgi:hypothetical protein
MKLKYIIAIWLFVLLVQTGWAQVAGTRADSAQAGAKAAVVLSSPYPNPVNNLLIFNYKVPQQTKSASIHLFDLTGRKVGQFDLDHISGQIKINLENYSNGIYFYTLYTDAKAMKTGRFVKKQG